MDDIIENLKECLRKVQSFLESICRKKFNWKVIYGWMDKREITIYFSDENDSLCSRLKTTVHAVYQHKANMSRLLVRCNDNIHD